MDEADKTSSPGDSESSEEEESVREEQDQRSRRLVLDLKAFHNGVSLPSITKSGKSFSQVTIRLAIMLMLDKASFAHKENLVPSQ